MNISIIHELLWASEWWVWGWDAVVIICIANPSVRGKQLTTGEFSFPDLYKTHLRASCRYVHHCCILNGEQHRRQVIAPMRWFSRPINRAREDALLVAVAWPTNAKAKWEPSSTFSDDCQGGRLGFKCLRTLTLRAGESRELGTHHKRRESVTLGSFCFALFWNDLWERSRRCGREVW